MNIAKKIGRPLKKIDKGLFEKLCAIQSTITEICAILECDDKTLEVWCKREYEKSFSEVFKEKRCKGFISLRRAQFQRAIEDKNTAMLIFLGKNWLGQRDEQDVEVKGQIVATTLADLIMENYGENTNTESPEVHD